MKTGQRKRTCPHCGQRGAPAVGADLQRCESCAEVSGTGPDPRSVRPVDDDTRKRDVVARLREQYRHACGFLASEPAADSPSFAHLEWILGSQRNPDEDGAALGAEVSQLVVLWLEDLVLELDNRTFPDPASSDGDIGSNGNSRKAAAEGLRTAARTFAEAFLIPGGGAVSGP